MLTFDTFDSVEEMFPCRKTAITYAKQIPEPFMVRTMEGAFVGKPGDYLMKGVKEELYICDKKVFESSYEWTGELPSLNK